MLRSLVGSEMCIRDSTRIKKLMYFGISPNFKYIIIIFFTEKKKLLCRFYQFDDADSIGLSFQFDLTIPFQKIDLTNNEWCVQFSRDEQCCLLCGFIFTFKNELLHTVNNRSMNGHFLVTDSLNRNFVFTSSGSNARNYAEVIQVYEVMEMDLFKVKDLHLRQLGIDHVKEFKLQNVLLLVLTRQNIYIIDPFDVLVLRTLNIDFEVDNAFMNWSGEEILTYAHNRMIDNCELFYLNGCNSLKALARRAVLSSFSHSQLKTVNIPKTLRSSLGV